MKQAIVDTGYIVALWHNQDDHHQAAADWTQNRSLGYELVTTNFVTQEVFRLLTKRIIPRPLRLCEF
jgi:predicted nucleic acid-binding protein